MNRSIAARGQALLTGIVFMLVMAVMVQALSMWAISEAKWSRKDASSSMAFNAAYTGMQQGYWMITKSPANFNSLIYNGPLAGYNFDKTYPFQPSGYYTIAVSSTPNPDAILIQAVGRDNQKNEARSLQAVYVRNYLGNVAVQASNGVAIAGSNFQVEWGAVVSPQAIVTNDRSHPQFWSATGIDLDTNGPTPPNCDAACVQWHSYNSSVGPMPTLDLNFYKSSAQATGTYFSSAQTWKSQSFTTGNVYYIDGDLTVQSPGDYIQGTLVVMGNLNLPNGKWGNGNVTMAMPTDAWKQYGNDWSFYRSNFDPSAPASFPGLTSSYVSASTITKVSSSVFVNGFIFVQGNVTCAGGGGNGDFYGAALVGGSAGLGSNSGATLYYSSVAAKSIRTVTVSMGQASWRELVASWPSSAPP